MHATASRRRLVLIAALTAAVALGGCVAQPPPVPTAPAPTAPAEPTDLDLELLALEHHAAYGEALVATVDAGTVGVESTALLEELATPEVASLDAMTVLSLLGNGQRLVAYADAVDATLRSASLPTFEVLLCVDPTALRYEELDGAPMELDVDGPWPMVVGYEHRPGELPLATFQALDPSLADSCE